MATFGNQGGGFNAGTNWGAGTSRPVYSPPAQSSSVSTSRPQVAQSAPQTQQRQIDMQQRGPDVDYSALLSSLPLIGQLASGALSDQGSIADALSGKDGRYISPQAEGLLSMAASQAGKYSGLDPRIGGFIPAAISLLNNNPEGALRQASGTGAGMLAAQILPEGMRGFAGPLATLASGLVGGDSQSRLIESVGNSAIGALPGLLGVANPIVGAAYGVARMLGMNPMQAIGENIGPLRNVMYPDLRPGMEGGIFGDQGIGQGVAVPSDFEMGFSKPFIDESDYSPSINLDRLDAPGLKIGQDASGRSGLQIAPLSSYEGYNSRPEGAGDGSFGSSIKDALSPIETASDVLSESFGIDTPDYNPYDNFSNQGAYNQRGEFFQLGSKEFNDLIDPDLNAYAGFYDQYGLGNSINYDTPEYLAYTPGTNATYSAAYKDMFSPDMLAALGKAGFENPYGTLLKQYGWNQTSPGSSGYYEGHEGETWIPGSFGNEGSWQSNSNMWYGDGQGNTYANEAAYRSGAAPLFGTNAPIKSHFEYLDAMNNQGPSGNAYDTELPYYAPPPVADVDLDYGMYQPDYGNIDANGDYYSYADQNYNNNAFDTWN